MLSAWLSKDHHGQDQLSLARSAYVCLDPLNIVLSLEQIPGLVLTSAEEVEVTECTIAYAQ
jgi:hypothetical protein